MKFVSFLQGLIGDITLNTYLIKTRNTNDLAKKIFITVRAAEARRLRKAVDGYVYNYGGREYPLQCWQEASDARQEARHRDTGNEGLEYSQPSADLTNELDTIEVR